MNAALALPIAFLLAAAPAAPPRPDTAASAPATAHARADTTAPAPPATSRSESTATTRAPAPAPARAPAPAARAIAPLAAPPAGPASVLSPAGRCGTCHPAERVQFERSLHRAEQLRCVSCHGGNDQTLEKSAAHGRGWRGRIPRREIPALCASCHASQVRMRAYNLPVDQYALYQTSVHGQRLAQGDTRVAVCSDCHGAHEILSPTDPASSVYVINIPRTCGRCHGDPDLLKAAGMPDNFHAYMKGVHARELERGDLRAPTCVSCHGVHGAAPPSLGDVDKVCGQCHTSERRYYTAGAHRPSPAGGPAAATGGPPECVNCHDPHATEAAQPQRLAASCAGCHEDQPAPLAIGRRIAEDYRKAAADVDQAAALVARADAIPIPTEDYHARIEEARTYLREALPAAHAVQEDVVAPFTTRAGGVGREVQDELKVKFANLRTRRYVLVLFWFYVLLTLYVLKRFRDQAARTR
ncbi:MAG TPA: cytochrome c3 family protein [Terriglobales bacterium]|nr:cytochrome c3 family protein [Terriglobales bacterium]